MSATQVFILIEGREVDGFFYSEMCRPVCRAAGVTYEIVRADRVGDSGGKQTLIGLHKYLESRESLTESKNGTFYVCMFYLDKDVDDILRRLVKSFHVKYTPFYDVENALFFYGDVVRAAAAASSLDADSLASRIIGDRDWRRESAERWKDFVVLCLFTQKHGLACDCNYRRSSSPLNDPPETPAKADEVAARKTDLRNRSSLSLLKFDRKYSASERLVERIYRNDAHDCVFKGKWYVSLMMREIELAAGGQQYNRHALSNGLTAALAATLDFNAGWVEYFRTPLRALIGIALAGCS